MKRSSLHLLLVSLILLVIAVVTCAGQPQISEASACHGCPTGQPTYSGATPTRIVWATATPTVQPTQTASPTPQACAWRNVQRARGVYIYRGGPKWQFIRIGPGTQFRDAGLLQPGVGKDTYWKISSGGYVWLALNEQCTLWVAQLGTHQASR